MSQFKMEKVMIRTAGEKDAAALAELMTELGYPTTEEEMKARFGYIKDHPDYRTVLAELDGRAAGMAGLIREAAYERNGLYVRVAALVVGSAFRRRGIGALLMQQAEAWAAEAGAHMIVLNSGNRPEREAAHLFYKQLGYELRSSGFVKRLH